MVSERYDRDTGAAENHNQRRIRLPEAAVFTGRKSSAHIRRCGVELPDEGPPHPLFVTKATACSDYSKLACCSCRTASRAAWMRISSTAFAASFPVLAEKVRQKVRKLMPALSARIWARRSSPRLSAIQANKVSSRAVALAI